MRRLLCLLGFHGLAPLVELHPEKATNPRVSLFKACRYCGCWIVQSPFGKSKVPH